MVAETANQHLLGSDGSYQNLLTFAVVVAVVAAEQAGHVVFVAEAQDAHQNQAAVSPTGLSGLGF